MSFSLAERDRRWTAVRILMESAGIDLLVVPDRANTRYLTQLEAGPVIFPLHAEPTVLADETGWDGPEPWVHDVRPRGPRWARTVVDRMRELGADGRIVGISGLDSLIDSADGDLNYNSFVVLREWLSHTRWVGASALLRDARDVKSDEEIQRLTVATHVAEDSLSAALSVPAEATDRQLWAKATAALALAGSEPPFALSLRAGVDDGDSRRPSGAALHGDEILLLETSGRIDGYGATIAQTLVSDLTPEIRRAWEAHQAAWEKIWTLLRPGMSFDALIDAGQAALSKRYRCEPRLKGIGLGDDLPAIAGREVLATSLEGPVLREGECVLVYPEVVWKADAVDKRLGWGDAVVITSKGARRLGTRPRELALLRTE